MRFPDEQRQQHRRHVLACAKKHEAEIEQKLQERDDAFIGGSLDKERRRAMSKAVAEGKRWRPFVEGIVQ